jgi:demethylmenaquinone methyltransferase/2-methoxy-6-polyprenyl-1,4-benzoquinol methylase
MALYRGSLRGRALRELDPAGHLDDPGRKQPYVTFMFDLLAPGYDAFTRVFSFGMDAAWKASLIRAAAAETTGAAGDFADLACGTGDLTMLLRQHLPRARVFSVDISAEMLGEARKRHPGDAGLRVVLGDVSALAFRNGSMDGVTVGYGLRNLPDAGVGIAEIRRILKGGGVVAILDFFKPRGRVWRSLFVGYLFVFGSLAGWLWHGDPTTFNYIARSIRRFVTLDELVRDLSASGFDVMSVERRLGGGIGLVVARKPAGGA